MNKGFFYLDKLYFRYESDQNIKHGRMQEVLVLCTYLISWQMFSANN